MKIKSIHKEDDYYSYRKQLIGLELVKSKTDLIDNRFRKGYKVGTAITKKKISLFGEPPDNEFYFQAVKVED